MRLDSSGWSISAIDGPGGAGRCACGRDTAKLFSLGFRQGRLCGSVREIGDERRDHTPANMCALRPAPWFHQRSCSNPNYAFDTAAGRYIVLCFFISAGDDLGGNALRAVLANRSPHSAADDVLRCSRRSRDLASALRNRQDGVRGACGRRPAHPKTASRPSSAFSS